MAQQIRITTAVAARPLERLDGLRLTLLLHGLGSHEQDLLPLDAALGEQEAVVALRAPLPWGPGFAWAEVPMEEAGRGLGLAPAADAVLAWLDGVEEAAGRPSAVRLLGFSQGGATALTMLRRAPGRFERLVVLAGFVPDEAEAGDEVLAASPADVFWGRGDADPVIPAAAVARTAAWLEGHADATVRVYPGLAHGVSDDELADVATFLR